MSVNKIFKWQKEAWIGLLGLDTSLPHAMLFFGPAGTGKGVFAEQLATRLLCETAVGTQAACGHCQGCTLLASGNHPDFRKVSLEEAADEENEESTSGKTAKSKSTKKKIAPSTQIKIDQIRALEDFVFVGSHRQGKRIVVIDPADAMNVAASNALLKILEEPPASVYFILVTSNLKRLLPTLRSRSRQLLFGIPDAAQASAWLKENGIAKPEQLLGLAGGAPLKALALSQEGIAAVLDDAIGPLCRASQNQPEPLALAAHWDSVRRGNPTFLLEHLVDTVQKWLYDLTRVRHGGTPHYWLAWEKELAALAPKTAPERLHRLYGDLLKIRATARHPLNELLFLEDLAARCVAALAVPKSR